MIGKILVGPQTPTDTALTTPRGDRLGGTLTSDLRSRYAELVSRNQVYRAATQALVTTTVGLATTYTGLVLSNPKASTVNLEVIQASLMQSVLQATQIEAFALATGFSTTTDTVHTTPVTPVAALAGGSVTNMLGLADVSATLAVAPTYDTFLQNTATATQNGPGGVFDIAGSIVLRPGAFVCFVTPAQASVAGMWFSFKWAEVAP